MATNRPFSPSSGQPLSPTSRGGAADNAPELEAVIRALSMPLPLRSEWHATAIRKYLEATNGLVADLPFAARVMLVEAATHEVFRPGEVVVRQGEGVSESSRFYIVLRGRLGVFERGSTASGPNLGKKLLEAAARTDAEAPPDDPVGRLLAVLGPGAAVGEKAMLEREGTRTATLLAQEHTDMLAVLRDDFLRTMSVAVAQQRRSAAQKAASRARGPAEGSKMHHVPTAVRLVGAGASDRGELLPALSFSAGKFSLEEVAKHLDSGEFEKSDKTDDDEVNPVRGSSMSWREPSSSGGLRVGFEPSLNLEEDVDVIVEESGSEDEEEEEIGTLRGSAKKSKKSSRGRSVRFAGADDDDEEEEEEKSPTKTKRKGSGREPPFQKPPQQRQDTAKRLLHVLSRRRHGELGHSEEGGVETLSSVFQPAAAQRVLKTPGPMRTAAELDYLAALLARLGSVGGLPTALLRDMCRGLSIASYRSGEVIRSEGVARKDVVELVLQGRATVYALEDRTSVSGAATGAFGKRLMELGPGDSFGEECLFDLVGRTEAESAVSGGGGGGSGGVEAKEKVTVQVSSGCGAVITATLEREKAAEVFRMYDGEMRVKIGDATAIAALSKLPTRREQQDLGVLESLARQVPALRSLPPFVRRRLCERWEFNVYEPGEIIHEWLSPAAQAEGVIARGVWKGEGSVFVVLSGTASVQRRTKEDTSMAAVHAVTGGVTAQSLAAAAASKGREPLGVVMSLAMARRLVGIAAKRARERAAHRAGRLRRALNATNTTARAKTDDGAIGISEIIRAGERVLRGYTAWPDSTERAKARGDARLSDRLAVATSAEASKDAALHQAIEKDIGPTVAWIYSGDSVGADEDASLQAELARAQAIEAAANNTSSSTSNEQTPSISDPPAKSKRKSARRLSVVGRSAAAAAAAKVSQGEAATTQRLLLAASFRGEAALGYDSDPTNSLSAEDDPTKTDTTHTHDTEHSALPKHSGAKSRVLVARTQVRVVRVSLETYESVLVASGLVDAMVHAPVSAAVALRKPPHLRGGDELRRLAEWLATHISFLRALSPSQVLRLCRVVTFRSAAPGSLLIRQGDPATEFFMVLRGTVHAHKTDARSVLAAAEARLASTDAERRKLLLTRASDTAEVSSGAGPTHVGGVSIGPRMLSLHAGDSFGHAAIESATLSQRNASVLAASEPLPDAEDCAVELAVVGRDAFRHLNELEEEEEEEEEEGVGEAPAGGGIFDPGAYGDGGAAMRGGRGGAETTFGGRSDGGGSGEDGGDGGSLENIVDGKGSGDGGGGKRSRGLGNVAGIARAPSLALSVLVKPPSARTADDLSLLTRLLSRLAFVRQLPTEAQEALGRRLRYRRARAGQLLIAEGDEGREFFVLLSGICAVHVRGKPLEQASGDEDGGGKITEGSLDPATLGRRVARLLPGDSFGESSLAPALALVGARGSGSESGSRIATGMRRKAPKRNASVMALTPTEVLVLGADDLAQALGAGDVEFRPRLLNGRLRQLAVDAPAGGEALSAEGGEGSLGGDDLRRARLQLLRAAAKGAVGFADMNPQSLLRALEDARYERLPADAVVYLVGERADRVYAVLEGAVDMLSGRPAHSAIRGRRLIAAEETVDGHRVPRGTAMLVTLGPQSFFGEVEALGDLSARVTTAVCSSPVRLLSVSRNVFLQTWPKPLLDAALGRWQLLTGLPGMARVSQRRVADLYYLAAARVVDRGAVLARQGEAVDDVLVLESGMCSVQRAIVVPRGAAPGSHTKTADNGHAGETGPDALTLSLLQAQAANNPSSTAANPSNPNQSSTTTPSNAASLQFFSSSALAPPLTLPALRSANVAAARRREAKLLASRLSQYSASATETAGSRSTPVLRATLAERTAPVKPPDAETPAAAAAREAAETKRRALFVALGAEAAYAPRADASLVKSLDRVLHGRRTGSGNAALQAKKTEDDDAAEAEEMERAMRRLGASNVGTRPPGVHRSTVHRAAQLVKRRQREKEHARRSLLSAVLHETKQDEASTTTSTSTTPRSTTTTKKSSTTKKSTKSTNTSKSSASEIETSAVLARVAAQYRALFAGEPDVEVLGAAARAGAAVLATATAAGLSASQAAAAAERAVADAIAPGAVVTLPLSTAVRGACFGAESLLVGDDETRQGAADTVVVTSDRAVVLAVDKKRLARMVTWHPPAAQLLNSLRELARVAGPFHAQQALTARRDLEHEARVEAKAAARPDSIAQRAAEAATTRVAAHVTPRGVDDIELHTPTVRPPAKKRPHTPHLTRAAATSRAVAAGEYSNDPPPSSKKRSSSPSSTTHSKHHGTSRRSTHSHRPDPATYAESVLSGTYHSRFDTLLSRQHSDTRFSRQDSRPDTADPFRSPSTNFRPSTASTLRGSTFATPSATARPGELFGPEIPPRTPIRKPHHHHHKKPHHQKSSPKPRPESARPRHISPRPASARPISSRAQRTDRDNAFDRAEAWALRRAKSIVRENP